MTAGQGNTSPHRIRGDRGRLPHHLRMAVKMASFPVIFQYYAPTAKIVSVTGSFHHGARHPMRRTVDGYWHTTLELKRGRYEYRFLVDGVAALDPKSFGTVSNPDGGKSSLLEVGY